MFTSRFLTQPLIGLLFGLLLAGQVGARQVDGLYDIAIPVTDQGRATLNSATRQGLQAVLIRVSGSSAVVKSAPIAKALGSAASYIRQYSYAYRPIEDDSVEQMEVFIEFEPQLVDKLLRQSGHPLWSSNRPTVLLWMAVEDSDGRRFVNREQDADIIAAIEQHAGRRGLAIKLPDLDLQDMVALSVDELWQLNPYSVSPAAERYHADTLLLGRVTKLTNGEWLGRWVFSFDQQQISVDGEALSADEFLAEVLDQVAENLAKQYAVAPMNVASEGLLMHITGVVNFADYSRVIRYLESVAAIRHANVVYIEGDTLVVQLLADGLLSQLQQSLALGKRLQPVSAVGVASGYAIDLFYHWPTTAGLKTENNADASRN